MSSSSFFQRLIISMAESFVADIAWPDCSLCLEFGSAEVLMVIVGKADRRRDRSSGEEWVVATEV